MVFRAKRMIDMTRIYIILFLVQGLLLLCTKSLSKDNADSRTKVVFHTDKGDIVIALSDSTPRHRDHFLQLVRHHQYDSLLFHRVIPGFMIQTGDPSSRYATDGEELGSQSIGNPIPAEIVFPQLYHKKGAVAAARLGDEVNPEKKSSGSQFFIVWGMEYTSREWEEIFSSLENLNRISFPPSVKKEYIRHGGAPHLDGEYTVFGEVISGMKTVGKILDMRTDRYDRPFDNVRITGTEILCP